MPVTIEGSKGVNGGAAEFKSFNFGVVGDRRGINAFNYYDGTYTFQLNVGWHILGDTNSSMVLRKGITGLPFDLRDVGVGGMESAGLVPDRGAIAIYHIYNPSSDEDGLLGTMVQSPDINISASNVYSGQGMPAGYTHSSLVGILYVGTYQKRGGISGSAKTFVPFMLKDRKVAIPPMLIARYSGPSITISEISMGTSAVGASTLYNCPSKNSIRLGMSSVIKATAVETTDTQMDIGVMPTPYLALGEFTASMIHRAATSPSGRDSLITMNMLTTDPTKLSVSVNCVVNPSRAVELSLYLTEYEI